MSAGTLLIRADASVAMGTGHVMRCLALAQAWQDAGGRAAFLMARPLPAVRDRLLSEKIDVVALEKQAGSAPDADQLAELALARGAEWVVVDGYHFGTEYQRQLKAAGLRILFLDDNGHAGCYAADLILNQNVHADEGWYAKRVPYTRLLLGPRYALLRREFRAGRGWNREIPARARKIAVSMGGSDPENVTGKVIAALRAIPIQDLEVRVIVGGSNPHAKELERAVQDAGDNFHVLKNVSDMPEVLAWADVMVAAAGSICWEICGMGLPAILLVTAENQKQLAPRLAELGAAVSCDAEIEGIASQLPAALTRVIESQALRRSLSLRAKELVDMNGAERVVRELV